MRMIRLLITLLALTALSCACRRAGPPPTFQWGVGEHVLPVLSSDSEYRGTAVRVWCAGNTSYALTAKHLFDRGPRNIAGYAAEVVQHHAKADLSVVMWQEKCARHAFVGGVDVRTAPPTTIVVIAGPHGRFPSVNKGHVTHITTRYGWRRFYHDAATEPGSSGGGVFNERGHLVGIVSGAFFRSGVAVHGSGYAVHTSHLREMMNGLLNE